MVGEVEGEFYEAGSSRSVPATLRLLAFEGFEISYADQRVSYQKGGYVLEPPLASLPRVVHFIHPDGDCRFETKDLIGFRQMDSSLTSGKGWAAVAWLEGHWKGTVASVALLAVFCVAFFLWGLPAIAWKVADDMPQSWRASMTDQSLRTMEKLEYVGESQLEADDKDRVQRIFDEALALANIEDSEFEYELRLFAGTSVGANAFAFPSGVVVATDEFVDLCETDEQIRAVFLHEIAHVEQQHGIRALVQRGGVFIVFSILVGDASSAISLAEGIPALVMNSQYSQRFELESDTFAAETLEGEGLDSGAMEEILVRLHGGTRDVPIAAFLSSHPSLQERVDNLKRIQAGEQ